MLIMFLFSLILAIVGLVFWIKSERIHFFEWACSFTISFVLAMMCYFCGIAGMTTDTETWSGFIDRAVHQPEWVEEYQQAHTRTVGKTTTTYYTTEHRTHSPEWFVDCVLGNKLETFYINSAFYDEILKKFGKLNVVRGNRPGFDYGDPNDYIAVNKNRYMFPVTQKYYFENKIKATPSVFSFVKVPENVYLYDYPSNENPFKSDRLLGKAKNKFKILDFDRMNTRLGASKKVNVIIAEFTGWGRERALLQEAKWIGGKKNDLVICYADEPGNKWAYVFGWTEKEIVKQNLESMFDHGGVSSNMLENVAMEIIKNYQIKDWSKFDYIAITPPTSAYIVFIILLIIAQSVYWFWAFNNNVEK